VQERPETLSAESYRLLRTNLQLTGTDLHLPSLLITSPSRGDGKSEISANLAVSLARAGKQVILVDANLRRPRIASLFGLSDEQGLSNLFDTPHAQITPQPIASEPRLSVVPAGPISPNAPELLGSQRMFSLIQEFKSQADVVIFDSPPLLYSDALALAPQLDGVVLVVNSGTTGRENTVNAAEALKQVGATIVGTVLNRVKAGPAYSYYPTTQAQRKLALPAGTNNLVLEAAPNETLEPKQLIDEAEANIEDGDGEQVIELNGPTNPSTRKNRSRNG
jgi:capsular exopolysaccharide synthesis family protein